MNTVENNLLTNLSDNDKASAILLRISNLSKIVREDDINSKFFVGKWQGEITASIDGIVNGGQFAAVYDENKPVAILGDYKDLKSGALASIIQLVLSYPKLIREAAHAMKELEKNG